MTTKLLLVLFAFSLLTINASYAQFEMDQGTVNISVRTGAVFLQTKKFNENAAEVIYEDFKANAPAFGAGFEMAFWDNISIGCDINFAKYKTDVKGVQPGQAATGYHTYGDMTVLAFIFHAKYFTPIQVSKLATYVRADLLPFGIFNKSTDTDYSTGASSLGGSSSGVKMTYGFYAGGDWELTPTIGAFAEVGYGYTMLNAGLRLTVSH
jgi:hypothetical protein